MTVDPIVRAIRNIIRMRGGESTLILKTPGVYDPVTSTITNTEESFLVKTIVFEAKESVAPNSLIKVGDKQMFVQAEDGMPAPNAATSLVEHAGKTYRVVWSKELNPSGTAVMMYELFIRG